MPQSARERALAKFEKNELAILVATDVAARGIDIDDVAAVIHNVPPLDAKTYLHRSGRTGRAGMKGHVFSLVERSQRKAVAQMAKAVNVEAEIIEPPAESDKRVTRPGALGSVVLSPR
jgi:superfamily II DNA/RNA helicase